MSDLPSPEPKGSEPSGPQRRESDPGPLFSRYFSTAAASAPVPDLGGVRMLAARRRRTRWTTAAAVAGVLTLAVPAGVYVLAGRDSWGAAQTSSAPAKTVPAKTVPASTAPANTAPANTVPTPAPTPASTPATSPPTASAPPSIEGTNWSSATVKVPANSTGCAAGTATFRNAVAEVGGTRYRLGGGYNREETPIAVYGDVTGDGRKDALLVMSCLTPDGKTNPPSVVLLLAAGTPLKTLGMAFSSAPREPDGEGQNHVTSVEIRAGGLVVFDVHAFEGMSQCQYRLQWTGTAFSGNCNQ